MGRIIMVTGGSGMLGHGLQWAISPDGANLAQADDKWIFLSSKDGDLRNASDVEALYKRHNPTHIIHLAAIVGGVFKNMRQPADIFHDNILMNTYVSHNAHVFGVKKAIICLSSSCFPDKIPQPFTEEDIHKGPPHETDMAYSHAKRMAAVQGEAYNKQYGDFFTSIIPVNIFGPYGNFILEDGHAIASLINKMYLAEISKTPIIAFGSGKPLRQFVYSRDVGRFIVWMLDNYESSKPITFVDENCEISIANLAADVAEAMNFRDKIQWDTSRSDGTYKKTCSSAKLRSLYPDFKFTPFKIALKETCDWFKANYTTYPRK